jgi:hypothetical protein
MELGVRARCPWMQPVLAIVDAIHDGTGSWLSEPAVAAETVLSAVHGAGGLR